MISVKKINLPSIIHKSDMYIMRGVCVYVYILKVSVLHGIMQKTFCFSAAQVKMRIAFHPACKLLQ